MVDWILGKISHVLDDLFNIIADAFMWVLNHILSFLLTVLSWILPAIGISPKFLSGLDTAIATLIGFINGAGYFIPLQTLTLCIGVIASIDIGILAFRIGQWVLKFIRG